MFRSTDAISEKPYPRSHGPHLDDSILDNKPETETLTDEISGVAEVDKYILQVRRM